MLTSVDRSEQELALTKLLDSRTFRRSDQLKKLIRYLCEAELEGRRQDFEEYLIGTRALGRSSDFSPDSDSGVRTRVHALRQKLTEYYEGEGAEDLYRIELPRGSYIPLFERREELAADPVAEVQTSPPLTMVSPARRRVWPLFLAGLGSACLVAVIVFAAGWVQISPKIRTSGVVRDFWKPLLDARQPVVICVGQPVHVWVRDLRGAAPPKQNPSFPDSPPTSPTFRSYYTSRTGQAPPPDLVLHPSPNSPLWGDSAGATAATRFLSKLGVETELLPEGALRNEFPLRNRHALIFGRPEFSELVASVTPSGGFGVAYDREAGRFGIFHQADHSKRFYNSWRTDEENFGLITVLRNSPERMSLVFSGITSDGALAGIEFLTSSGSLEDLAARLRREGYATWPPRFQVVVRTTSSIGYPMRTSYAGHFVYKP